MECSHLVSSRKYTRLMREICGTNLYALSCSLVRNEYNGRHAAIG